MQEKDQLLQGSAMERRQGDRVGFERGYTARIMAIDGTWQRDCRLEDVSDTGAKLKVRGSIAGLNTEEFFLMLSSVGKAYRRCERVWVNGPELGVRFIKDKPSAPPPPAEAQPPQGRSQARVVLEAEARPQPRPPKEPPPKGRLSTWRRPGER